MDTLLVWLGGTPVRYWTIAALAGTVLLAASWATRRIPAWMFLVAVAACLFAFRWPIALYNGELGVDEGQVVAGAQKFVTHPIAWKHVDLNTAGPLNAYVIAIWGWIGLPVNFLLAHVVALALIWTALAGSYLLLRQAFEERVARCAILPAAACFSFSTFHELVYYTSEHLSIALLGIGTACVWRGIQRGAATQTFVGMGALGAIPWAKLQGVPMALWVSAFAAALIAARWSTNSRQRWRLFGAWLAGGLFVTAVFGLMLVVWNLLGQWHTSYIQQAGVYVDMSGWGVLQTLREFLHSLGPVDGFRAFLWPLAPVALLLLGAIAFGGPIRQRAMLILAVGGLLTSCYAVAAPGRVFFHYLLLLVIPATLLVGVLLGIVLESRSPEGRVRSPGFVAATLTIFLLVTLLPQSITRMRHGNELIPYVSGHVHRKQGPAARELAARAQPGDMLSVWGWMPRLYVESGLPQATRDGQTERQILGGPLQAFYRNRYLYDLKTHRPRFFVEAVGPGHFAYEDRATAGFETWPELREYIRANYAMFAEVEHCRLFCTESAATSDATTAMRPARSAIAMTGTDLLVSPPLP